MEKKFRLNIVDIVAVLLILVVAALVGNKLMNRDKGDAGPVAMMKVNYTVRCDGVAKDLYDSVQKYIPSQLMASGSLYNGYITGVEQEPYYVMAADGSWVEDRDHVCLLFTVEATIPKTDVITTEIAKQEVRIGRSDYILKSEYIEFKNSTILDAEWTII